MLYIAMLSPAFISLLVLYRRDFLKEIKKIKVVMIYFLLLAVNALLAASTVCAIVGGDVRADSFVSMSFFVKYLAVAMVYAIVVPAIYVIIKEYVHISLVIEKHENEEK